MEIDEGMLQWGLRAAGMNLPFLPTRVGIGTDVLKNNPHIKFVESPYDDKEKLVAMPAIKLDVALLHVNESDEKGNTLIFGPDPFFDDLFARAASNTFVSTEKLVGEFTGRFSVVTKEGELVTNQLLSSEQSEKLR